MNPSELIERLNLCTPDNAMQLCDEVADTIDQLSAEVERLKEQRDYKTAVIAESDEHILALTSDRDRLAQRVAELEAVLPSALKEKLRSADERVAELEQRVAGLESVLRGVIAEADRDTVPFIQARALLATPPHGKDAQGEKEEGK